MRKISAKFIWTKEREDFLTKNYPENGKMWCANELGATESQIRYKASILGLRLLYGSDFYKNVISMRAASVTGRKRPGQALVIKKLHESGKIPNPPKKERICSVCNKAFFRKDTKNHRKTCSNECFVTHEKTQWQSRPHPKGMAGKTHSDLEKQRMSKRVIALWKDKNSKFNSMEASIKRSQRNSLLHENGILGAANSYSRCARGWVELGDKRYFMRSKWEANYARYLDFLKNRKEIKDWEYESDIFRFDKIKQGVVSYKPDFKVINNNDTIEYHEVKGWMDAKSATKLKRMAKYYPNIKLILIDERIYKSISRYKNLIQGWS